MDPRPLLPFVFLLRSPAYMFLLFSQQLWSWEGDEEADLLWIGFDSGSFSVCRDESNCKANPLLCVAPLLFLLFSAVFFCFILWFLVFCVGLASVPPFCLLDFFRPFFFVVPLFYRVRSVVTDGMQRDDNIKMSITEVSGWLLPFTAGNGLWLKKKKMNSVLSNDAILGYEVAICVLTREVLKVLWLSPWFKL